jgi:hypothetical protein
VVALDLKFGAVPMNRTEEKVRRYPREQITYIVILSKPMNNIRQKHALRLCGTKVLKFALIRRRGICFDLLP